MSTVVSSGQTSAVASGEFASGWIVLSSGSMFVFSGGAAIETVDSGGFLGVFGGSAVSTFLASGAHEFLSGGGTAIDTFVGSGATLYDAFSGTTINTVIGAGGVEYVTFGGLASVT